MPLHDAVEIKKREADLQKSPWLRLVADGLFLFSLIVFLGVITNALDNESHLQGVRPLIMISLGGLYLAYHHHKDRRRIEILELELLKLKRRLSESES
jgi:uncharacterized membrane-anchored protein